MPWESVTVSKQRQSFIRDYVDGHYTRTELAERFGISRKTAYKWINRFKRGGLKGIEELSRRPRSCPWQTDQRVVEELVAMRKARPSRGPKKLLDKLKKRHRYFELPAVSTVAQVLDREGLVRATRRHRRAHPGCPKNAATAPNDIWAADYKGQFRLKNGQYCFPLTVSDLYSRYYLAAKRTRLNLNRSHDLRPEESELLPNKVSADK
jgi:transposase